MADRSRLAIQWHYVYSRHGADLNEHVEDSRYDI